MSMHSNSQGPVPRVLLVDDAPDNRLLMSLYLRRSGVEILTAQNGEEALQVTASMLPDLVVLDLTMTGMSCDDFVAFTGAQAENVKLEAE